jgi:hypothetical protein
MKDRREIMDTPEHTREAVLVAEHAGFPAGGNIRVRSRRLQYRGALFQNSFTPFTAHLYHRSIDAESRSTASVKDQE